MGRTGLLVLQRRVPYSLGELIFSALEFPQVMTLPLCLRAMLEGYGYDSVIFEYNFFKGKVIC